MSPGINTAPSASGRPLRLGVQCFLTDKSVSVVDLARAAEDRGFDELWFPEHTHIPTGRDTAWPMEGDAELPEMYKRAMDPFASLAAAAAVTERITIGTAISLVAQHHPITLAKTVSTIDHMSNGRVILGVGFGWNVDEMKHHGVNPDKRRTTGREHVLAMQELWGNDIAEFHGDYVDFGPSWQWPKPVQTPHPPVWVGGGKSTMKHALEYGQGWMPIQGVMPVVKMATKMREMVAEAGRDVDDFAIYPAGTDVKDADLEAFAKAGLDGIAIQLTWDADMDQMHREMDDILAMADRVLG